MPKAYILGQIDVTDHELYVGSYVPRVRASIAAFGGRFIVRGGAPMALEGDTAGRIVVIEFDSRERALDWYNSAEYQEILQIRQVASSGTVTLLEGFEAA